MTDKQQSSRELPLAPEHARVFAQRTYLTTAEERREAAIALCAALNKHIPEHEHTYRVLENGAVEITVSSRKG